MSLCRRFLRRKGWEPGFDFCGAPPRACPYSQNRGPQSTRSAPPMVVNPGAPSQVLGRRLGRVTRAPQPMKPPLDPSSRTARASCRTSYGPTPRSARKSVPIPTPNMTRPTRIAAARMVVSFTGSFWYVRYRTRPSKEDKKRTHFVKQHEGVRPCRRVWKTKSQPFTYAEAPKTSRAR